VELASTKAIFACMCIAAQQDVSLSIPNIGKRNTANTTGLLEMVTV